MKRILAVSGGVDSMVMLDYYANKYPREELVVATFDHKSRESSKADADFVSEVTSALKIPFYRGERKKKKGGLSEAEAREARYKFLFNVAFREKGEIYTAQHTDDLIESIVVNLIRGTRGRGLAAMGREGVRRPFLEMRWGKKEILRYASKHEVRFREDPSNSSDIYLRNRIRGRVRELGEEKKKKIIELWAQQRTIYQEVDKILESIIPEDLEFSREMFRKVTPEIGREILRAALLRAGVRATGSQIEEFRQAILFYHPGKQFNLPRGRLVRLGRERFRVGVAR